MGSDLLVIIPTRGRPGQVPIIAEAFRHTCTADTKLVFAVDEDDPDLHWYTSMVRKEHADLFINTGVKTMVACLNAAAFHYLRTAFPYAVAFMGDDHLPVTPGWDSAYLTALRELGTGLVYGDDLLQGERIPTQIAMTADIPNALGHMAPDNLTHLFVDNYWLDLGRGTDRIRYLPDVIVEHRHPFAQKAAMDAGYARVNDSSMYRRDSIAYKAYADAGYLAEDIQKILAVA